jgi:hypothetical protein
MKFSLGCSLIYHVPAPMPFVFNVEVASFMGQTIQHDQLSLDPDLPVERWTMPETGNRYLRVIAQPGDLRLRYEADVVLEPLLENPEAVTEVPAAKLPFQVMSHLYPSRYCQSDKLLRFAKSTFGELPAGYRRVNGICNWIRDNVEYQKGVSDALTSAFDTVTERAGVCRDFAHLAIALCRAMGIPARYISAYAWRLAPPDFHAVIEAYLQGPVGAGWYLFDPTRMSAPDGLVRIGIGRDAADVAFSSPYGDVGFEKPEVWISGGNMDAEVTTQAVRLQLVAGKSGSGSPVLSGLNRGKGRRRQASQRRMQLGPLGSTTAGLKSGRRTEMTDQNQRKNTADLAAKYQVSPGAVEALIHAIRSGGGRQAQFNHPDLGGMGQWGGGDMIMIGDMFNHGLKDRVLRLCQTIASHLNDFSEEEENHGAGHSPKRGSIAGEAVSKNWWPSKLGSPSSTGSQNSMRYAFFPDTRRLAIERDGELTIYNTGAHRLSGFSQQQSTGQSLTFTSQDGLVRVEDLKVEETCKTR